MTGSVGKKNKGDETRQRILDASQRLFAEKGFDGAGIDEIGKTAGVTKSLIYYYFESKRHILDQLIERFVNQGVEFKKNQAAEFYKNPTGNLATVMRRTFDFMTQHRDVLRIMFVETIKKQSDFSMLPYLDPNVRAGFEAVAAHGIELEDPDRMLLGAFFIGFMPIFGFQLLGDEFCRHYELDAEWAKVAFNEIFAENYFGFLAKYAMPKE